jgi:4-phospho-D-threonate 3-dehydrogenase / 4-phospho-D-erythronate 3-dehydrogenase
MTDDESVNAVENSIRNPQSAIRNLIGISLGDITGVGPEVALKAVAAEAGRDEMKYLFIGDEKILWRLNEKLSLNLPLQKFSSQTDAGKFFVANPLAETLPENLPAGSPPAASASVAWLRDGGQRCLRGELDALVTAPVNKKSIIDAGHKFVGQTEFLSELAGMNKTAMMLLGTDERGRWLRVALATVHIAIKSVPEKLTAEKITLAIELAAQSCRDLGLSRAKIAVAGLNPHAGEGGEFGDEEIKFIAPTVLALQKKGFDVVGPLSGDTVFHYALQGDFDAVVAMYHDQGLAPLKAVAFDTGVNWTLGLPFIRTSPDHGTAYDIAGKGIANPSSMIAAIRLAKQLAKNRS